MERPWRATLTVDQTTVVRVERADSKVIDGQGRFRRLSDVGEGETLRLQDGRWARLVSGGPEPATATAGAPGRVVAVSARWVKTKTEVQTDSERIETTPDHRFRVVGRGWVRAEELLPGERLVRGTLADAPSSVRVEAVHTTEVEPHAVYNLEVSGHHTYYVGRGSVWVHNGDCVPELDHGEGRKVSTEAPSLQGPPPAPRSPVARADSPALGGAGAKRKGGDEGASPSDGVGIPAKRLRGAGTDPEGEAPLSGTVALGEKIGEARGKVATGGLFRGKDGVERYIKQYADPEQAHAEHISGRIYLDAGVGAPRTHVFEHEGKTYFASDFLPDFERLSDLATRRGISKTMTPETFQLWRGIAKNYFRGAGVDQLLLNTDLHGANLGMSGHRLVRIDNGGSFQFLGVDGKLKTPTWFGSQGHFDTRDSLRALLSEQDEVSEALKGLLVLKQKVEHEGGFRRYLDRIAAPGMTTRQRDSMARDLESRMGTFLQYYGDKLRTMGKGRPAPTLNRPSGVEGEKRPAPSTQVP